MLNKPVLAWLLYFTPQAALQHCSTAKHVFLQPGLRNTSQVETSTFLPIWRKLASAQIKPMTSISRENQSQHSYSTAKSLFKQYPLATLMPTPAEQPCKDSVFLSFLGSGKLYKNQILTFSFPLSFSFLSNQGVFCKSLKKATSAANQLSNVQLDEERLNSQRQSFIIGPFLPDQ